MSGVHRTVRCNYGAMATSGANGYLQRIKCAPVRAERTQWSGTPMLAHQTPYSSCPVRHRSSRQTQRQSSNGRNPNVRVTWLAHRTVRCTIRQTACTQTASLVVGAINTPNHPTFKSSNFSTSQPLTRARHSILDTLK
jgi:hypothetical protein